MKRLLVVALVVVVLFTGIPVVMGMPVTDCVDCDVVLLVAGTCVLAVLMAMVGFALALLTLQLHMSAAVLSSLLAPSGLDRPPRLA